MDFLQPPQQVSEVLTIAQIKAKLSIKALVLRGMLAGMVLGFAIMFAWTCAGDPASPVLGTLVFPAGFAVITLLALELVTGNFGIMTFGKRAGKVSTREMWGNWGWSMLGNLLGSLLLACLIAATFTKQGEIGAPLAERMLYMSAEDKVESYKYLAFGGWLLVLAKGILCGLLVGFASFLGLSSMSSVGRLVSVWFPIAIFFALGLEHSVVNMFVIPAGMMLGAPVSPIDALIWNLLPVTLGNLIGAWFVAVVFQASSPEPA